MFAMCRSWGQMRGSRLVDLGSARGKERSRRASYAMSLIPYSWQLINKIWGQRASGALKHTLPELAWFKTARYELCLR